jgi:uncharacterized protein (DUF305 family)
VSVSIYPLSHRATFVALLSLAGCQSRGGDDAAAAADHQNAAAAVVEDTTSAAADSAFLTRMSDHHQGLVEMSRTADRQTAPAVKRDAARLREEQVREQQQMGEHLSAEFGARHDPMTMPKAQAMIDSLKPLKDEAYARMFYHHVVAHHREGIRMMDSAMPHLRDPRVKEMASRMKQQQTEEVKEFETKMTAVDTGQ